MRQVQPGSPAASAGLEEGDSLVKIGEALVIFLEPGEVEELLDKTETELKVTVERFELHFCLHQFLHLISLPKGAY